ncbi:MAG: hypothetical protein R2827_14880 [Bdellovibrionales bacterium]
MKFKESLRQLASSIKFTVASDDDQGFKVARLHFTGDIKELLAQNSY